MNRQVEISSRAYKDFGDSASEAVCMDAVITVKDETLEAIRSLVIDILEDLDEPLDGNDGLCIIDRDELDYMTDSDILDNLILAMKEQNAGFFEEDEDMIEYHYTIDVALLLKNNFQDFGK